MATVPHRARLIVLSLPALAFALLSAGCNRQDVDCLGRIGRKVAAHAKSSAGDVGAKLDFGWAAKKEPTLQEKIQDRLRYENTLTDVAFEVGVKEKEVELKGTVKTALQRQTAINLADTVAGVSKVIDSIKVLETEEAPK
jgi:hypothetical protein